MKAHTVQTRTVLHEAITTSLWNFEKQRKILKTMLITLFFLYTFSNELASLGI